MALKTLFIALTLACLIANAAAARDLAVDPRLGLAARLETSGGLVECWNALMEIRSCTNEIILFFLNGQAVLGRECCQAIGVITRNCWPSMLISLGFTAEEGNILEGYCEATSEPVAPAFAPLYQVSMA